MKRLSLFAAALLAAGLLCTESAAVRDEQFEPGRKFWRLGFKHTGLHYVKIGGRAVAYTTYRVTNDSGADRILAPIFRVETETNKLTYAMPAPAIAQVIRAKHGRKFLDVNQITGVIKNKESKLGVAIFFKLDPHADHVKLYVKGLTDAYRYQDEENRKGFQRQEWLVHWFRPGDARDRQEDRVDTLFNDWVWRSTGTAATAPAGD